MLEDAPLVQALLNASHQPHAAFYTPGHKRGAAAPLRPWWGPAVLAADLPELPDLDNLFAPEGVIRQAQQQAAQTFGAEDTWFLTNGSTAGVIAAILATCGPGESIILPRNIHQSAVSGLILSGAVPVFVPPTCDPTLGIALGVTPHAIAQALAQTAAKAVLVVSPTYYGTGSDLEAIAQHCHRHHLPLIVDEAHGAHFAAHPHLPKTAMASGADVAVQSTHKTLSALTQSAMVHRQGERIEAGRLASALQMVQSTSPNYLLLASLDAARQQLATQGHQLLEKTLALSALARQQIPAPLTALTPEAVAPFTLDLTRLTVDLTALGITGFAADEWLYERGVVAELPELRSLTFILSLGTAVEEVTRLVDGLKSLKSLASGTGDHTPYPATQLPLPKLGCSPREAYFAAGKRLPIGQAAGRICKATVCAYPPGIPALLPGEIVTEAVVAGLRAIAAGGGIITGLDGGLEELPVVA